MAHERSSVAGQVVAGAAAGSLGLLLTGPLGVVVAPAALPLLLRGVDNVADEWKDLRDQRAARLFAETCSQVSLDPEGLSARLTASESLTDLAGRAVVGAIGGRYEARVVALGRALANAVDDEAVVDEEFLFVEAITALDVPHARLLDYFARSPYQEGVLPLSIERDAPTLSPVYPQLRAVLERHALVENRGIDGGSAYHEGGYLYGISAFGRDVIGRLYAAGFATEPE